MKTKTYLLTLLFLGLSLLTFSQASLGIKVGAEQVTANHKYLYFEFVDESPSQDFIVENFTIPNAYTPITITPYYSIETDEIEVEIEVKLGLGGELRTLGTYLGATKYFGNQEKSSFGIGGSVGLGRSKVDLGDIFQNDTFIQINGSKYYGTSLSVGYLEQQLTLKPHVRYKYKISGKYPLLATLGYQYPPLSFNGKVEFRGSDTSADDTQFVETVSLKEKNIAFFTDNMQRKKKLFNQQGIFFNIGIALPL